MTPSVLVERTPAAERLRAKTRFRNYRRLRGEDSDSNAIPNPKPTSSPSTSPGQGESPVIAQYRSATTTASTVMAAVAASTSSSSGSIRRLDSSPEARPRAGGDVGGDSLMLHSSEADLLVPETAL